MGGIRRDRLTAIVLEIAYHSTGIAGRKHSRRYVSRDHATRADHRAIAYPNAGQDDRTAADPDIRSAAQ
jgi:hypothetical protein